jgi:hypothetical protein
MILGKTTIDPSRLPGVLDTATWDRPAAIAQILRHRDAWAAVQAAGTHAGPPSKAGGVPRVSSVVAKGGHVVFLAELADTQKVLLQAGPPQGDGLLGTPFFQLPLPGNLLLAAYPTDAGIIDLFCRTMQPRNAPRVLGGIPRLGIGTRMTTRLWPGVFAAMERKGFAANAIQNSVRELNLLDDMRQGLPPERNYASGFGMIESGYTGSTFEGLWVAGVLSALQHEGPVVYGADADHVQPKRADPQMVRALRVVEAARYYSFFTVDTADLLSYEALTSAEPDASRRYAMKFDAALKATTVLADRIAALRDSRPFDLEFAFDEHPPEIEGPACITGDEELSFVAREIIRRRMPVTHLAPNLGVEKGFDYRLADGLAGLEKRVAAQHRIAQENGFLLDIHSADDLSSATRRAIGRATKGKVHFKISPSLHLLYAATVKDFAPKVFQAWWDDCVSYARAEAQGGSRFAADCISAWEKSTDRAPSTTHEVFRHFFFAWPGRRGPNGEFLHREMLYTLPDDLYRAYQARAADFLCTIADDLYGT